MAIFLVVLGTILAVSGLAAIMGGAPFFLFGFDSTLILSGTFGLVGGLVIVGLGRILAVLADLGTRLDRLAQPSAAAAIAPPAGRPDAVLPRPPARPQARPAPVPAPPSPPEAAPDHGAAPGPAATPAVALDDTLPPPVPLRGGPERGFERPPLARPVAERPSPERPRSGSGQVQNG